jgi:hypothetical protein
VPLTLVLLAAALAAGGTPTPAAPREVPLGAWGGTGVALTVEESGAKVELDCAHGRIDGRLAVDADGRFELPGTIVREGPGPVRMGPNGEAEEEKGQSAVYFGRLEGDVLHLGFYTESQDATSPSLELKRGQAPRLRKCL